MQTFTYLFDPAFAPFYRPAVVTALAIALLCALLSVLVVLKRLAFVGQGISHAAFGGVGLAAFLGLAGALTAGAGEVPTAGEVLQQFLLITAFCTAAALLMAWLSEKGRTESDTAIGIVLVASMAAGAILSKLSQSPVAWESFLFGSLLGVGWVDAALGWGVALLIMVTLWFVRRPLIFWAFDPPAASAWGVRGKVMNFLLMTLLAIATVTAMRLAGVVLATAMLVLPGAIALRLSKRSGRVIILAGATALLGVLGGLVLSFELGNWPPGASIVCVMSALFFVAVAWQKIRGGR